MSPMNFGSSYFAEANTVRITIFVDNITCNFLLLMMEA